MKIYRIFGWGADRRSDHARGRGKGHSRESASGTYVGYYQNFRRIQHQMPVKDIGGFGFFLISPEDSNVQPTLRTTAFGKTF